MLRLRSSKSFTNLLELDPVSGDYHEFSEANLADAAAQKVNGFFDFLSGKLVAFYLIGNQLVLRIGENAIAIGGDVAVVVDGAPHNRFLRVMNYGKEIASIRYAISDAPTFVNDPTPFLEDEDFDFGLYVANVTSSHERRRVALEEWKQA